MMSNNREITNEDLYAALVAVLVSSLGNGNLVRGLAKNLGKDNGLSAGYANQRNVAEKLIREMKDHL